MIINLPKHKITQRIQSQESASSLNSLQLKEIPLSYINVDNLIRYPNLTIESDFLKDTQKPVFPYTGFQSENVLIFNKEGNIVNKTLKRVGDTYYYEPQGQIEFTPLNFEAYLEIQEQKQYYNDTKYDIKVAAIDPDKDLTMTEKLMYLFGNSYRTGQCPANIKFNGGSTNSMTLLEQHYYDADFVFTKSTDGIHYGSSKEPVDVIDISGILDNHTNLWIFCDDYQGRFKTVSEMETSDIILNMSSHILYDNDMISIPRNQAVFFDQTISFLDADTNIYDYEYLNEAVLIIHKKNKGFIVISPSWFLDDITAVSQIMYEAIIKCYLSRYYKSRALSLWITDDPIDYVSYQQRQIGRNHNKITLKDFLPNQDIYSNDYLLKNIIVTSPFVRYVGITTGKEFMFKKVGGQPDPVKEPGTVSVYTTKHTIINYQFEDLYTVESPIDINFTTTDNEIYLIVNPYTSSSKNIHTATAQTFRISDLTENYTLFVGKGSTDISNTFFLIKDTDIPENTWIKVASLTFDTQQVPVACDARIMGGGIPLDQEDDYDMLDIGHIFGRPYRKGSSLIIRLPIILQNYEDRIKAELDKHIAAGDEYVLIFEKRS